MLLDLERIANVRAVPILRPSRYQGPGFPNSRRGRGHPAETGVPLLPPTVYDLRTGGEGHGVRGEAGRPAGALRQGEDPRGAVTGMRGAAREPGDAQSPCRRRGTGDLRARGTRRAGPGDRRSGHGEVAARGRRGLRAIRFRVPPCGGRRSAHGGDPGPQGPQADGGRTPAPGPSHSPRPPDSWRDRAELGSRQEETAMATMQESTTTPTSQASHATPGAALPEETLEFFGGDELRARVFIDKYALRERYAQEFYWLLEGFRFIPGGRIMHAVGNPKRVTALNCYVIPIKDDSIEAIFEWMKEAARTYSLGGGVGTDISVLRPQGAPVNNAARTSTGSTSFMELMSLTTGTIGQSGRRGALMITIADHHPDVLDFIRIKRN